MRNGRWKRFSAYLNESGLGNALSLIAIFMSFYALIDSKRTQDRNDLAQLMEMQGQMFEANAKSWEYSGVAMMKLSSITDQMSPKCVAQRDEILEVMATVGTLADASQDSSRETWEKWLKQGKSLGDYEFDADKLPIGAMVQYWVSDAKQTELMGDRMLKFSEIIVDACLNAKEPPDLPSEIQDRLNRQQKAAEKAAPQHLQVK